VQEATDTKTVFVGAKVTVREEGSDEDEVFYIVGSKEANSLNNKISNESPLGAALMGAKVRQKVSYEVPAGKFTFTIKKIEKA
ncbi:MAG: GreA/GreB family elongation factor, partial [Lachnospiraceae bacterium]|nr:GreA/GreB family elongation factor [Lachnospiraceae bacterium]